MGEHWQRDAMRCDAMRCDAMRCDPLGFASPPCAVHRLPFLTFPVIAMMPLPLYAMILCHSDTKRREQTDQPQTATDRQRRVDSLFSHRRRPRLAAVQCGALHCSAALVGHAAATRLLSFALTMVGEGERERRNELEEESSAARAGQREQREAADS